MIRSEGGATVPHRAHCHPHYDTFHPTATPIERYLTSRYPSYGCSSSDTAIILSWRRPSNAGDVSIVSLWCSCLVCYALSVKLRCKILLHYCHVFM